MNDEPRLLSAARSIFLTTGYLVGHDEKRLTAPETISTLLDGQQGWRLVERGIQAANLASNGQDVASLLFSHPRVTEYFDVQALSFIQSSYQWVNPLDITFVQETSDTLWQRWRLLPRMIVFQSGFFVLSIEAFPVDAHHDLAAIALPQLLNFNEHFRCQALKEYQRNSFRQSPFNYRVSPDILSADESSCSVTGLLLDALIGLPLFDRQHSAGAPLPQEHRGRRSGVTETAIPSAWQSCFPGFNKMICATLFAGRDVSDVDFFRLATIDASDSKLPAAPFLSLQQAAVEYTRWAPAQRIAFTGYSMAWQLDLTLVTFRPYVDDCVDIHFPKLYGGALAILITHQLGAVSEYSRELALFSPRDADYNAQVQRLRDEIIPFMNRAWFSRVTYEVQGHELYEAWRRAMELADLYKEVQDELTETDDYLRMQSDQRLNQGLSTLQVWLVGFAFASFILSAAQNGVGQLRLNGAVVPMWIVALAVGGVAGFLFWIIFKCKYRW
jgi:hypothetical protein